MKTAFYNSDTEDVLQPFPKSREKWWRCFFDQSEDAQVVCRRDGTIEEANLRAVHLLNLKDGDTCPSLFRSLAPGDVSRATELIARATGRQETLTTIRLNSDERIVHIVDLQFTPLDGGFTLVMIKDASRRWRMESHAQRLMTAIDATPDVIFLTDADFRLTFVNSAFQSVTGYNIEEALGQPIDFLRAPGQDAPLAACRDNLLGEKDWGGELINRRQDGSDYPVESSMSSIFDFEGERLGYAAFERDITLKKRLQEDLRLERNLIVSINDSLDAAIYTVDREFKLTHVNNFWQRLPLKHGWLAWGGKPRPGMPFLKAIANEERRKQTRQAMEGVLENGRPYESQVSDPAQRRHWFIRISPWRHEGRITGLIYTVTDQTRLNELQNQLYQAQKMETIGALAAGVAHDFNNLLQAIRGHVALMLLRDDLGTALSDPLDQIDQAASRASEITHQLLTFSRASDENPVDLDFNEVIREAAQFARRSLNQKIQLKLEPADGPVFTRLDATRAQQLLLNLCVNAIDAMPDGGELILQNRRVNLDARQAEKHELKENAPFICCSVRDTGSGMPPEVVSKIFDPFYTTKAKGKGTGLGMSIVHGVISHGGGFLEIDTAPGKGTAFQIYLPEIKNGVAPEVKEKSKSKLVRGSGRVLVVDDLDLVRDFARAFLEASGYTVLVAASGEEALEVFEAAGENDEPVDLLLTDLNMTGISGQQLIREVIVRWPSVKCILASGYLEPAERELVETHLGARILNKPFNVREAANLISGMLSN